MTGPLAALCGLAFGAGLWLAVDGLTRRRRTAAGSPRWWQAKVRGLAPARVAGGLLAAAAVGIVTRWPVAALLAAVAAWTLPAVLAGARSGTRAQQRLEAIAIWADSLRGALQAAAGLEQAITATAPTAPEPIRTEVVALAAAIQRGARLPEALHAFAADLNHPDADRVVAALLMAATGHARNLADQLGALATAAREQASARLRIDTEWSTTRTSVRVIIAITVLMAIGMVALHRDFLAPYDSAAGQIVLAVVGAMFGTAFFWLHRLGRIPDPPRVLDGPAEQEVRVR